jgi:hypothetical protein
MTQLDLVVRLCRELTAPFVEDALLHGCIDSLTAETLTVLRKLDADDHYMLPTVFDEQRALGQPFEVRDVAVPRLPELFFANTWDELLQHHSFRFAKPKSYFVLETNFYSVDATQDQFADRYSQVVALIKLLEEIADVSQPSAGRLALVFMVKEKFELIIDYGAADLRELSELDSVRNEFIVDDAHTEQRKSILKSALVEMLKNVPGDERFRHLLTVFDELKRRARDNYQLYVAGFSFEKVREEVQENRLEYTLKLNKVFAEIQNQLLAVPAALLLVGSQMDEKAGDSLKNWALWFGALIFTGFMNMLLRNQRHSLKAINDEISELKEKLTVEHAALATKLMPMYGELDKRYKQQKNALLFVEILIAGVLLFCTFLFGRYCKFW